MDTTQSKSVLEIVRLILEGGSFAELTDPKEGVSVYTKRLVTLLLLQRGYDISQVAFSIGELIKLWEKTGGESVTNNLWKKILSTNFNNEEWIKLWKASGNGPKRSRVWKQKIEGLRLTFAECEQIITYSENEEELDFALTSMAALLDVKE